ncbi:MAG: hypothetical protein ACYDEP_12105 [Acidimicrobiales bacterium]
METNPIANDTVEDDSSLDSPEVDPDFQAFVDVAEKPVRKKRAARQPRPKSTVKRHVEITLAVAAMHERQRFILAMAVGVENKEVLDIATAVIETGAKGIAPISALLNIANADPIEAGVYATELAEAKPTFKAMWRILAELAPDIAETPPVNSAKAGLRLAKAVKALDQKTCNDLQTIVTAVT